jgi:hypothetical protein
VPESAPAKSGWLAVWGLGFLALALAIFNPFVVVAIPFAFLALGGPDRNLLTALGGTAALVFALGGAADSGLWLVERGWAILLGGGFLAATLARPALAFTDRALMALAGAFSAAALVLGVDPQAWEMLDWLVKARILEGAGSALETLRLVRGDLGLPDGLEATLYETADLQGRLFPALVGLGSLAGLGLSWVGYTRLAHRADAGLGPFAGFRFSDGMVWVLIAGVALMVVGLGEGWHRAGLNALVFMGGLYVLRGAAVVVALNGGVSLFGFVLLGLGLLFVAPLILVGALMIGLGDTWIDLRSRIPSASGGPESQGD